MVLLAASKCSAKGCVTAGITQCDPGHGTLLGWTTAGGQHTPSHTLFEALRIGPGCSAATCIAHQHCSMRLCSPGSKHRPRKTGHQMQAPPEWVCHSASQQRSCPHRHGGPKQSTCRITNNPQAHYMLGLHLPGVVLQAEQYHVDQRGARCAELYHSNWYFQTRHVF